jgi:hypothetical protein
MASLGTLELSRRRNSSVATLMIRSTEDFLVCYFGVNHRRDLGNDAEIITHGVLEVLQSAAHPAGCATGPKSTVNPKGEEPMNEAIKSVEEAACYPPEMAGIKSTSSPSFNT